MSAPATTELSYVRKSRLQRLRHRLRTHGLGATLVWAWCQSVPRLTGVPVLADGRITPQVYFGPQHGRLGAIRLWLAGFRHTVSLRAEFDDAAHRLTIGSYFHLPIADEDAPTIQQLGEAIDSIHDAVGRGHLVYIHCRQGRGRAPTLAAAYLISLGVPVKEALAALHRARRSIVLTPLQITRLHEFAEACVTPAPEPLTSTNSVT